MKNVKIVYWGLLFLIICQFSYAQNDASRLSGSLEANGNFFMEDSLRKAYGTPQYDHQLYGAEAWLQLNYSNWGFDVGLRFDLYNNSNLPNPQGSDSGVGIGRWYIKKSIHKLGISAGYLYDQIGSGIIFRAYEARSLFIDNALYGLRLTYDLTDDWRLKVFTGQQKRVIFSENPIFDTYPSIINGGSIDGFFTGDEDSKWSMAPGFGVINRTLDDETMNGLVSNIAATYHVNDSIGLKYNVYAFSLYNTLTFGKFSWYVEGAYKTAEQYFDPDALKTRKDMPSETTSGKLVFNDGSVLYTSLSYANKGFGVTVEAKRTERFKLKTDPNAPLNNGAIGFIPPMSRVNTYRLTARYQPATQELGEWAFQGDFTYAPNRKLRFNVNVSHIRGLNNPTYDYTLLRDTALFYNEIYTEVTYKIKRKWQFIGGVQFQQYNQDLYEVKPGAPIVETVTPYIDVLYKFDRKKSLRIEAQFMDTQQDYGSWLFGLAAFAIAPHWTFTVSDMYNINPNPGKIEIPEDKNGKKLKLHYPRFDIFYAFKGNRFSLSYVKQVDGIICTGGICRYEPAFSGIKLTVNSTF